MKSSKLAGRVFPNTIPAAHRFSALTAHTLMRMLALEKLAVVELKRHFSAFCIWQIQRDCSMVAAEAKAGRYATF